MAPSVCIGVLRDRALRSCDKSGVVDWGVESMGALAVEVEANLAGFVLPCCGHDACMKGQRA